MNNPEDAGMGTRRIPFSRTLYIERDDFREAAPQKFHRLTPGREVRLRYACYVTCTGVVKDPRTGEIAEVHCRFDPASRGGGTRDGRKVRGTIHWVSAEHAREAEVRLYDRLFSVDLPDADKGVDFTTHLNPRSLEAVTALVEPSLAAAAPGDIFQFERLGYFCADSKEWRQERPVFNRTVALRDSWAKSGP